MTPDGSEPRTSFASPLSASMDSRSPAQPTNRTPGAISSGPGRELAWPRPAAGGSPGAQTALRLAELVLERGDALLDGLGRPGADGGGGAFEQREALLHQPVRGRAGHGLDPPHAGPDALLGR